MHTRMRRGTVADQTAATMGEVRARLLGSAHVGVHGHPPLPSPSMSTLSEQHLPAVDEPLGTTPPKVSVVIPCLNEGDHIQEVVRRARAPLEASGVPGEVVVAATAPADHSARLAVAHGACVVHEPRRGYGSA